MWQPVYRLNKGVGVILKCIRLWFQLDFAFFFDQYIPCNLMKPFIIWKKKKKTIWKNQIFQMIWTWYRNGSKKYFCHWLSFTAPLWIKYAIFVLRFQGIELQLNRIEQASTRNKKNLNKKNNSFSHRAHSLARLSIMIKHHKNSAICLNRKVLCRVETKCH